MFMSTRACGEKLNIYEEKKKFSKIINANLFCAMSFLFTKDLQKLCELFISNSQDAWKTVRSFI